MSIDNKTAELQMDIKALCEQFRTVLMATCTPDGVPEVSYTPYVIEDGRLYVFVSELSLHTGNLLSNPKASLLFIEDEDKSSNLHARKRVTFSCSVSEVDKETPEWELVLTQMERRFGEIISVLKSLPDFHLFAMDTEVAVIVRGFADAHTVPCAGF